MPWLLLSWNMRVAGLDFPDGGRCGDDGIVIIVARRPVVTSRPPTPRPEDVRTSTTHSRPYVHERRADSRLELSKSLEEEAISSYGERDDDMTPPGARPAPFSQQQASRQDAPPHCKKKPLTLPRDEQKKKRPTSFPSSQQPPPPPSVSTTAAWHHRVTSPRAITARHHRGAWHPPTSWSPGQPRWHRRRATPSSRGARCRR